jgi:hypothetical protein
MIRRATHSPYSLDLALSDLCVTKSILDVVVLGWMARFVGYIEINDWYDGAAQDILVTIGFSQ